MEFLCLNCFFFSGTKFGQKKSVNRHKHKDSRILKFSSKISQRSWLFVAFCGMNSAKGPSRYLLVNSGGKLRDLFPGDDDVFCMIFSSPGRYKDRLDTSPK